MDARQRHEEAAAVRAEIRAWIARKGLTHSQVAAQMGHAPSWVSKRIGAKPTVPILVDDLMAFADVLGVPAAEFFRVADSTPGQSINYRSA